MENHPIPQDVTGFKFKLIGSVTVKQFLYLLAFGILAGVAFILQINVFIKAPLMALFAATGLALAFLPIEGRPLDIMLVNFARAIPSENRYIWRKMGARLSGFDVFSTETRLVPKPVSSKIVQPKTPADDKRAILISRLRNSPFRPDEAEIKTLDSIRSFFDESGEKTQVAEPISREFEHPKALPVEEPKETITEEQQKLIEEAKIKAAEKMKEQFGKKEMQGAPPTPKTPDLKLSNEPPKGQGVEIPKTTVKWSPSSTLAGGFPTLPDVANVVLGIVRDPRGKSLPNILVEVVDPDNIPVRAFKTNALGQFASATPLPDGSYRIYFEDPGKQHELQPIDIQLSGEIFQPIEAVSVDAREKLRRELFQQATAA